MGGGRGGFVGGMQGHINPTFMQGGGGGYGSGQGGKWQRMEDM